MKVTVKLLAGILVAAGAVTMAQQQQQPQQQQNQGQQKQNQAQQQQSSSQGQGAAASSASGTQSSQNLGTAEKPIMVVAATATAKGTVADKNRLLRTLTIKTDDGETLKLKVGRDVTAFDEIKEGDPVTFTYNQETAIALRKGPGSPNATIGHALITPTKGAPPVAAEITTIETSAVIEDIDQKSRTLKIRAPDGSVRSIHAGDDVKNLGEFNKGDQIAVRTSEAVAVEVARS